LRYLIMSRPRANVHQDMFEFKRNLDTAQPVDEVFGY
jgi:hypothetical protein